MKKYTLSYLLMVRTYIELGNRMSYTKCTALLVTAGLFIGLQGNALADSADISAIRKAAEAGDAEAQFTLGGMYCKGENVPEDTELCGKWISQAAMNKHPEAVQFLKQLYGEKLEDIKQLHVRAEQGDTDAQFKLGKMYFKGDTIPKDIMKAMYWLMLAGKLGHVEAQVAVAQINIALKDYDEAIVWFKKAGALGHPVAQHVLGISYYKGVHLEKDYVKAAYWAKSAAEQGYTDAQIVLGGMYVKGNGVPKDYIRAYAWLTVASLGGGKGADRMKLLLNNEMTADQVSQAVTLSQKLLKK